MMCVFQAFEQLTLYLFTHAIFFIIIYAVFIFIMSLLLVIPSFQTSSFALEYFKHFYRFSQDMFHLVRLMF